jgi:pimeloyl-ACP methyl ester carboxylesterase
MVDRIAGPFVVLLNNRYVESEPAINARLFGQLGTATSRYVQAAGVIVTRSGHAITQGLVLAPAAVRGFVTEAAWVATHLALYPVGARPARRGEPADRYSLSGLQPLQRGLLIGDIAAAGTPILLVHGLVDNRSIFTRLHRSLRRRGFGRVETVNLPLYTADVPTAAERLAAAIEDACERTGSPQVHVVAHSLGGLVARYHVQRLGGDERVHTLVTLGTPHNGTRLARLLPRAVPYRLIAELRPGSPLLAELAAPAPGCRTKFVAVSGSLDSLVRPAESALLHHPDLTVRNVTMIGLGHHALPFNSGVAYEIATALARIERAETGAEDIEIAVDIVVDAETAEAAEAADIEAADGAVRHGPADGPRAGPIPGPARPSDDEPPESPELRKSRLASSS